MRSRITSVKQCGHSKAAEGGGTTSVQAGITQGLGPALFSWGKVLADGTKFDEDTSLC